MCYSYPSLRPLQSSASSMASPSAKWPTKLARLSTNASSQPDLVRAHGYIRVDREAGVLARKEGDHRWDFPRFADAPERIHSANFESR
jgi:hypothetical protein